MIPRTIAPFVVICLLGALTVGGCQTAPIEDSRDAARDNVVRQNMRTVQIAAEHYAADHGGDTYPSSMDDTFKTYFPGGEDGKKVAPVGLINPFSGMNEYPSVESRVKDVNATRSGPRFDLAPGKIVYTVLDDGHNYAIVGGAHDSKAVTDKLIPGQVLVFSRI